MQTTLPARTTLIILPATNEEDLTTLPWGQLDGEPEESFHAFDKYYLALGPTRSLLKAFNVYLGLEDPEKLASIRASASEKWTHLCKQWRWRERAELFDSYTYQESRAIVEQARQTLLRSSKEAAETLQAALKNPRLQVAAAKEVEEWEAQFKEVPETSSVESG